MNQFGNKILSIVLVIFMACSLTAPVQVANKSTLLKLKQIRQRKFNWMEKVLKKR